MWLKAEWMGHPMRLELTRVDLLVKLANRYTTKGAPFSLHHSRVSNIFESTWLSINIEFRRVHEWVGNSPITYIYI